MLATFLITFREGLEAFLLVGILLAYLTRLGARKKAIWIYLGVVAGVMASVLSAVILQVVVSQFDNEQYRLMLTIGVMLTAVLILSYMALWMQKQAQAHSKAVQEQLAQHVSAGRTFGIAMLAFVSVLREGIETVLFLSAISYGGSEVSMLWGLAGLVLSALLVWILLRTTRQVPLRQFFRGTSLLLIVIAAGLLSSVVNQLQALGLKLGSITPIFDISHILSDSTGFGIFMRGLFGYNATPTLAQFVTWLVFLVVAVALWWRGGQSAASPGQEAA